MSFDKTLYHLVDLVEWESDMKPLQVVSLTC